MNDKLNQDYSKIVYSIIGAAYNVHSEMKWGLAEAIYEEALCVELGERGIEAVEQQELSVYYKGILLKKRYRMDIVVENEIIVELKTTDGILPEHRAQLFNYMRLTKKTIGLLINFGKSVEVEKYRYDEDTNEIMFYNNPSKL